MKARTRKTISYVLASALILGGTFCTLSAKGLSAQAAGTTYRVLSGGDVNHPYGSSSGLDLLVEAPCEELTGILVDGQAVTTFSISDSPVVAQDAVPKTGVAQYSEIFGILAIAAGLAVIYFERKRRIHAE